VSAQEVITRYVAALQEDAGQEAGGALAAFRLTRKTALRLGEFCQQLNSPEGQREGAPAASTTPEDAAHRLAATWLEESFGLEEAVLRPPLVKVLSEIFHTLNRSPEDLSRLSPPAVVQRFLAAALFQRLVFDLGEPLEAAAPGWQALSQALADLEAEVRQAAASSLATAGGPRDWHGPEAWVWVTRVLEEMLQHFSPKTGSKE